MKLWRYGSFLFQLTRRRDTKKLSMRFVPEQGIFRLTVPARLPDRELQRFLTENRAWMAQQLQRRPFQPAYTAGERHLLWGRYETLGEGLPAGKVALDRRYGQELAAEVKRLLPALTARMQLPAPAVSLREMTSRWGSYTPARRSIRLNLRLARLPKIYTEYVLIHELNHLRHPDHSAAFYRDMERFCPGSARMRQEIGKLPLLPLPPDTP